VKLSGDSLLFSLLDGAKPQITGFTADNRRSQAQQITINTNGPFQLYLSQKIGRTLDAQRDLRFYQVICGGLSTKFC